MFSYRIEVEISDVAAGTCDVLVVAEDATGQHCIIDCETVHWPPWAREWRPMLDSARKWLAEMADSG